MPWRYIDPFYEKLSRHTTIYGKYWLIFVTVFRLTVIPFADNCWSDEQKEFKCNTQEPGCNNVCFNQFAPINSVRLWCMQILAITAPLALYIVFVFHLAETNRRDIDKVEKQKSCGEDYVFANSKSTRKRNIEKSVNLHSPINIGCPAHEKLNKQIVIPDFLGAVRGSDSSEKIIWRLYIIMVIIRTILDGLFIYFQWTIYPYTSVIPIVFECTRNPCPHTVECWPSRVKEKTIFFHYMYIAAAITCLINLAELIYIGPRRIFNAFSCIPTKDLSPGFDEDQSSKEGHNAGFDTRTPSQEKRKTVLAVAVSQNSLPGNSPSPVLRMPSKKNYQYDRYFERRPTMYEEPPATNQNFRNLPIDQMDQLRRGSFLETSADRENTRNLNNNAILNAEEVYFKKRIHYHSDAAV